MDKPPDAAAPGRERRRRLRAVFAADAANFGGLVSVDETKTLDSLWSTRRIATQELGKHGGWLFGMPGDGIFALFESAIDAVRCALDIQGRLAEQPASSILNLRVGIHLGEVLFQDEIPFGEALVIAARLESLAEPGGILVSQSVMEAVAHRIQATFVDQGVRSLKHSPRQIKTYVVLPPGRSAEPPPPPAEPLDLTLVAPMRPPPPAGQGTARGTLPRAGALPIVESRPLPPPPAMPEIARPASTASPQVPSEPDQSAPEQTVILPGRRIAALLQEATRPAPARPVEDPFEAEPDPSGRHADAGADSKPDDLASPPPGSPDRLDGTTRSLEDTVASSDDAAQAPPPEPEFDPDRTVMFPRKPVEAPGRIRPLPKTSPFTLPEPPALTGPPPAPVQDPAQRVLVQSAIPDIAQALTAYLGPIARVLVKRHAETCSSPQALIEAVALEIRAEAERQAFRERAAALVSRLK